tara:strand:+ start:16407 stop:16868 length:462 start_codon:yes stop_codon:yes gene_type:complete
MKASDFVNLMRKVIREEVRSIVREELKTIKPLLKETKSTTMQPASIPQVKQKPIQKRTTPIVSFDGPLGDLLNETATSMMNESYREEEWPDMNGGALTADHAQMGVQSMASLSALMDDDAPLPEAGGYSDPTRAFMKDYSAVLKAADQHSMGR